MIFLLGMPLWKIFCRRPWSQRCF